MYIPITLLIIIVATIILSFVAIIFLLMGIKGFIVTETELKMENIFYQNENKTSLYIKQALQSENHNLNIQLKRLQNNHKYQNGKTK